MNYNRAYNNNRQDFSNRPPQQFGGRGGGMGGGGAYRSQAGYGGGGGRFNNSSVPDGGLGNGYGNGGQSIQEMTLRLNPGWLDEGEDIEEAVAQLKDKKAAELAAVKSAPVAAAVPQPAVISAQAQSTPVEKPSVSVEKPVNAGMTSGFGLPETTTSSQSPSIGFGIKQEWVKLNGAVVTPHSAQPPNSSLANGFGVNNGTSVRPSAAASGIATAPPNGMVAGMLEPTVRYRQSGWIEQDKDLEQAKKAAELAAVKSAPVAAAVPQPAVISAQAQSTPVEKPPVSVEKPVNAGMTSGFGLPETTTSSQSPSIGFGIKQEWVKLNGAVVTPHSAQPPNSSLANGFGVNNGTSVRPSAAASGIATAPPNGMVAGMLEPTAHYRQSDWHDQGKVQEHAKKAAELAAAKSDPVVTVVPQPPVILTQTPSMPVDKPVNEGGTLIENELVAAPVIHINIGPEIVESGNDVHLTQPGSRLIPRIVISSETPLGLNNSVGLKGSENGESKVDGQIAPFDGGLLSGFSKEDACAIASISQKFFEAYSEMNEFVQRICARQ